MTDLTKNKNFQRIEVVEGDITLLEVDAIVNAANPTLLGGGGVDGAIHRAAGPELLARCTTLGGCSTGNAKITPGYNLPSRYIIHTVGPIYRGEGREEGGALASCYRRSLELAIDSDCQSIAFPAISTGVFGYPFEEASAIAIQTTLAVLKIDATLKSVIFVLFGRSDFLKFGKIFEDIRKQGGHERPDSC